MNGNQLAEGDAHLTTNTRALICCQLEHGLEWQVLQAWPIQKQMWRERCGCSVCVNLWCLRFVGLWSNKGCSSIHIGYEPVWEHWWQLVCVVVTSRQVLPVHTTGWATLAEG